MGGAFELLAPVEGREDIAAIGNMKVIRPYDESGIAHIPRSTRYIPAIRTPW